MCYCHVNGVMMATMIIVIEHADVVVKYQELIFCLTSNINVTDLEHSCLHSTHGEKDTVDTANHFISLL